MLCYRNGLCCCWNSSSFLEDAVAILYASNFQLSSVLSTIIWACPMSTAQGTKVGRMFYFYLHDIPLKILPFFFPPQIRCKHQSFASIKGTFFDTTLQADNIRPPFVLCIWAYRTDVTSKDGEHP